MVPACATSSLVEILLVLASKSATTASMARSIPLLRSMGFKPAATALEPSLTIACANTVAVVVPSPATSLAFEATSLTICAPIF